MKASDLLVECLEREGVERVFGVPGEETEDLLFSIRDSDITFVPVRHEQGAAFMANVHGRLTGEAGVCLGTLGPGSTNLMTGVADANLDKAPLVALTGQGGLERLHKESHQALDIVHLFEPITKWNSQLTDPDTITESVRKAFKIAEYEKPGATHIEVPENIAGMETDSVPMPNRKRVRPAYPDPNLIEEVGQVLQSNDRALLIAGNGAVRTEAALQIRKLIDLANIPVASTYMGKGAVSDDSPHSLMTLNSGDHQEASGAIESADVIITVGYDIAEHDPADWNTGDRTVIVHIDSQPAEVYEAYNPDIELVCDPAQALSELKRYVKKHEISYDSNWYRDLRQHIRKDVNTQYTAEDQFTVRKVLPVLRDVMAQDDVLISDVGSHKMDIAQNFPCYEPNTCIISNGLASMGISVPAGIAADLATENDIVAATGDGGFLMNAAEIETATRVGCSYTILLFNNDDYGLISEKQQSHRGESYGTKLSNPDFVSLAESFGIDGYRPNGWTELENALKRGLGSDSMTLVEIPIGQ
ncbi:acetolactate synthase large subunit [Halodesulfurarchaeum sp.]|uniref:acetolactate synthase large subunit n=1 Tax=Halodesulfurarchaeum sp. TaxID=1980530 RepID=UPI002FC29F34